MGALCTPAAQASTLQRMAARSGKSRQPRLWGRMGAQTGACQISPLLQTVGFQEGMQYPSIYFTPGLEVPLLLIY